MSYCSLFFVLCSLFISSLVLLSPLLQVLDIVCPSSFGIVVVVLGGLLLSTIAATLRKLAEEPAVRLRPIHTEVRKTMRTCPILFYHRRYDLKQSEGVFTTERTSPPSSP